MRHLAFLLAALPLRSRRLRSPWRPPSRAEAADRGGVRKCSGGKICAEGRREAHARTCTTGSAGSRNLRPFCVHPALQRAARIPLQRHDPARLLLPRHKGRSEGSCQRVRRFGYRCRNYGENIAWGSGPKRLARRASCDAWMGSSGHRSNILSGKFREVGIGPTTGTFKGTRKRHACTPSTSAPAAETARVRAR